MNNVDMLNYILENPELIAQMIPSIAEKYKPALRTVAREVLGVISDGVSCEKLHEVCAQDKWNAYQALIQAGFTQNQAFAMVLADSSKGAVTLMGVCRKVLS